MIKCEAISERDIPFQSRGSVYFTDADTLGPALATALSAAVQDMAGPLTCEGNMDLGKAPGQGRMRMWVNSRFPTLEHSGEIVWKLCSALQQCLTE